MTPVDTIPGSNGCLSACLASVLGLSIRQVPLFTGEGPGWIRRMNHWLRSWGLQAMVYDCRDFDVEPAGFWVPRGFHIRSGPAVGLDGEHAVVYCGDLMVHDPSPPRLGISRTNLVIVLAPLDPAYWVPPIQMFSVDRED